MNLYCRLPFGKMHARNPEVIQLADVIGRTSGSIAMKLVNIASLDPEQQKRGIKGLSKASRGDAAIWAEFNGNWESLAEESELLRERLLSAVKDQELSAQDFSIARKPKVENVRFQGQTEGRREVAVRLAQGFFRQSVLASYGEKCCITGLPVPELLNASHILPWSSYPNERADPRNGLCLASTQDRAFDRGLLTLDEDFRVVVSNRIRDFATTRAVNEQFMRYEGVCISLPEKFRPLQEYLAIHRSTFFLG